MALASLLAQTYQNWECVFVDDGSTDSPEGLVKGAKDGRIRYHRLDRNVGRGAASQFALEKSKGDFIAILDADDWYYPGKLERQIEALRREDAVALLSAGMAIVDTRNRLVGVRGFSGDDKITFGPMAVLPPLLHQIFGSASPQTVSERIDVAVTVLRPKPSKPVELSLMTTPCGSAWCAPKYGAMP